MNPKSAVNEGGGSITEFNIKAERGQVSVLMRIRPCPSTMAGNDRDWDDQAAIRSRIDPMLARHIGQRLIDQANLADAFQPGVGDFVRHGAAQ